MPPRASRRHRARPSRVDLPTRSESIGAARRFVAAALSPEVATPATCADVVLVVSELFTDALEAGDLGQVTVEIHRPGGRVRLTVRHDLARDQRLEAAGRPRLRSHLVRVLSDEVHERRVAAQRVTTCWFDPR